MALLPGLTMAVGVALVASFREPEVLVVVMAGSLIGRSLPFS